MEEFKSEHLSEELEIATHFLKEPEAAEIRDILMERAAVGDVKRAAAFYKIIRYSYGSGCTSYGCQPFDIRKTFTIIWEVEEKAARKVAYADKREIEEEIIRRYMCCMESGENVENNSAVRSGGMQQNQDPSPAKRRRQTLRIED